MARSQPALTGPRVAPSTPERDACCRSHVRTASRRLRFPVELDPHRYIGVNERLEATAPEVRAVGECAGSPQFTHISEDDFASSVAIWPGEDAAPAIERRLRHVHGPPLAHVGLSEVGPVVVKLFGAAPWAAALAVGMAMAAMHLTGTFHRRPGSIRWWWSSTTCPGPSWSCRSASARCCSPCLPMPGTASWLAETTGTTPGLQGGGEVTRGAVL